MKETKTKTIQVRVTQKKWDWLVAEAKAVGVTVSKLIRMILDQKEGI